MKPQGKSTPKKVLVRPAVVDPPSVPFDRIEASYPVPVYLGDDDCATLESWLRTHRQRKRMSDQYCDSWGDSAVKAKLDAEEAWWNHVRFVAEYNQQLRQTPGRRPSTRSTPFADLRDRVMRLTRDAAISDKRAMHVLRSLKALAAHLYRQHADARTPGFKKALCQFRPSEDSKTLVSGPVSACNCEITSQVPLPQGSFDRDRLFFGLWDAIHLELSVRFAQRIRNPLTAGVTDKLTSDRAAVSARTVTHPNSEWRQWAEDFAACLTVLDELASEKGSAPQGRRGKRGASTRSRMTKGQRKHGPMTNVEWNVLSALAKAPELSMFVVDIAGKAGHNKKPTRYALALLEKRGYAAKPKGTTRKGYAITPKGIAFFSKHINTKSAAKPAQKAR